MNSFSSKAESLLCDLRNFASVESIPGLIRQCRALEKDRSCLYPESLFLLSLFLEKLHTSFDGEAISVKDMARAKNVATELATLLDRAMKGELKDWSSAYMAWIGESTAPQTAN